jgi:hypothetical protein
MSSNKSKQRLVLDSSASISQLQHKHPFRKAARDSRRSGSYSLPDGTHTPVATQHELDSHPTLRHDVHRGAEPLSEFATPPAQHELDVHPIAAASAAADVTVLRAATSVPFSFGYVVADVLLCTTPPPAIDQLCLKCVHSLQSHLPSVVYNAFPPDLRWWSGCQPHRRTRTALARLSVATSAGLRGVFAALMRDLWSLLGEFLPESRVLAQIAGAAETSSTDVVHLDLSAIARLDFVSPYSLLAQVMS